MVPDYCQQETAYRSKELRCLSISALLGPLAHLTEGLNNQYNNNKTIGSSIMNVPLWNSPARSDLSVAVAMGDWNRATALARGVPVQASVWSKRTGIFECLKSAHCLPLHEACVAGAPVTAVMAILKAYPEAARSKESSYGRLPLHCTCRKARADVHVVRLLMAANLSAVLVPDTLGRLPIHYALSNSGRDPLVIHALLSSNKASARGVDNAGWTPLHVACASGCPFGVIIALLEQFPEAAIMRTNEKGCTPGQCLKRNTPDRIRIKNALKEAQRQFDASFVSPRYPALLQTNHDIMIV
jgi:Ankyrin repeats (3 copies)